MMYVIDTKTNEVAWTLSMSSSPSPMAISKNPDGSTDKVFAQLGGFNGFEVVDFATHAKTNEIKLPELAPEKQNPFGPPADPTASPSRRIRKRCWSTAG